MPVGVVIVDKQGSLKSLSIKDYKEEELYKKCGFKKPDGFTKHVDWKIKLDGNKYVVSVFGKIDGKANMENKYDFPPPIDNTLFFGSCLIVCSQLLEQKKTELVNLSLDMWEKMYEKLFGGFEDLSATAAEDEAEEDELDAVPASKKTKQGYLKDGFVVESDGTEEDDDDDSDDDDEDSGDEDESEEVEDNVVGDELELEDIGSELSEEEYSDEDEE
jgi:hypothetical protein